MELRPVTIHAVAHIPLLVLTQGVVNANRIPRLTHLAEESLDHCGEQQPVAEWRLHGMGQLHRTNHVLLSGAIQLDPKLVRRTQNRLRKKGGVNQRLSIRSEIEGIWRI